MTEDMEITCEALQERLASGQPLRLLDVREAWEHAIAALPDSTHIPLNQLPARSQDLEPGAEWVVYCHHGVRSLYATSFLRQQGLEGVRSLRGGIDAWSQRIDPGLPRY